MANKRYYWLKLKENFFDEMYIQALRELPNGDSMVIVLQKMLLASMNNFGVIEYSGMFATNIKEVARKVHEDEEIVEKTVEALVRFKVIEIKENGDLYIPFVKDITGSETASTQRSRESRARKADSKVLHCNTNATSLQQQCNTEKSEIREEQEKELDADIDKSERENGTNTQAHTSSLDKSSSYGDYGHVKLTSKQYNDLVSEFGENLITDYIERMDSYCEENQTSYKNYHAKIKAWIKQDIARGWLKTCSNNSNTTQDSSDKNRNFDNSDIAEKAFFTIGYK